MQQMKGHFLFVYIPQDHPKGCFFVARMQGTGNQKKKKSRFKKATQQI